LLVCVWLTPGPTRATVHPVPAAHPDIAGALAAAAPGDTVLISPGTYLEHDLVLPSAVTLRGATGDPVDVIINGERAGRCIYGAGLAEGTRLEAVTLTGGLPAWGSTPNNYYGAGLFVDEGTLAVSDVVFTGNEASVGGGAYILGTGSPTFTACLFDGNEASETAGLCLFGTCNPVLRDCVFRGGDRTVMGGGVTWVGNGTCHMEDCTVEDNTVLETGGGVEVIGSGAVGFLRNCTIRNNTAQLGAGGLFVNMSGRIILQDCTVTGNTGGEFGGGVEVRDQSILEGLDSVILNNTAPLGSDGSIWPSGTVILHCCEINPDGWAGDGTLTLDNDGCGVATERATWDDVKARYR